MQIYPAHITHEEIEELPYVSFGGKINTVESLDNIKEIASYLLSQRVLGYDTETKPSFTKGVRYGVSLLQLSDNEEAFLFRLDKIGLPSELVPILQSPDILKVGAAISEDVRGMQKLRKFKPQGFVDLQKIVCNYGIEDKAVKKMAAIVLNLRISKSQQTSNWGAEKYTPEQKLYAATDAWVCREIYLKLRNSQMVNKNNILPNK